MRAVISTAVPLLVGIGPWLAGIYVLWELFWAGSVWLAYVTWAVFVGYLSTVVIVRLYLWIMKEKDRIAARKLEVMTDRLVWGLISGVLLVFAVGFFNRAIHGEGIIWLQSPKAGWSIYIDLIGMNFTVQLSPLDLVSFGLIVVVAWIVVALPRGYMPEPVGELRRMLKSLRRVVFWRIALAVGVSVVIWIVLTLWLGAVEVPELRDEAVRLIGRDLGAVLGSGVAVALVLVSFLLRKGGAISWLLGSAGDVKIGRQLLLNVSILPPLVIGLLALGRVENDLGVWTVYGLLIYAGFIAWTLSIRIASGRGFRTALWQLAIVFGYAWMLTLAWGCVLSGVVQVGAGVERVAAPGAAGVVGNEGLLQDSWRGLESVMMFAVGVILVQIVYGLLYRETWGDALSDRWPGERPYYIMFGIIVLLFAAALPQQGWKPVIVLGLVLVLLLVPGYLFRRRISAYVLLTVRPGSTERVQEALKQQDIAASVLFGSHDLIAFIEIMRLPGDQDTLLALGRFVDDIRRIDDVVRTETLVDFSQMARFRIAARGSE